MLFEFLHCFSSIKSTSYHNWIFQDTELWEGRFRSALGDYERMLYDAYSKGQFDNAKIKKTWTFANALFYCGTIYTTIGESTIFFLKEKETFKSHLIKDKRVCKMILKPSKKKVHLNYWRHSVKNKKFIQSAKKKGKHNLRNSMTSHHDWAHEMWKL